MMRGFKYNKDGGNGVTGAGNNEKKKNSAAEIIAGLTKATEKPLGGSKAITLVTPDKIQIPTDEILKMKQDMTAFMNEVNETNKLLSDELSGGTSKVSKWLMKLPWVGSLYEKNRVVRTDELMKKIIGTCNNNTDKVEADMKLLLKSGKDLKKFRESLLDLIDVIESENWSISEIEQVLNVLLERKNDTQIRETSEFVESFMTDEGKEKEREKLIGQIRAIADNAESMYKMMGNGVMALRFVRQELLTTGMGAKWVGQPAALLEGVATDALTATKDTALTSEAILEITRRSVRGMVLAIKGLQIIQEHGILSDKGVETIRTCAENLAIEANSLGLIENGNGAKLLDNGKDKAD